MTLTHRVLGLDTWSTFEDVGLSCISWIYFSAVVGCRSWSAYCTFREVQAEWSSWVLIKQNDRPVVLPSASAQQCAWTASPWSVCPITSTCPSLPSLKLTFIWHNHSQRWWKKHQYANAKQRQMERVWQRCVAVKRRWFVVHEVCNWLQQHPRMQRCSFAVQLWFITRFNAYCSDTVSVCGVPLNRSV